MRGFWKAVRKVFTFQRTNSPSRSASPQRNSSGTNSNKSENQSTPGSALVKVTTTTKTSAKTKPTVVKKPAATQKTGPAGAKTKTTSKVTAMKTSTKSPSDRALMQAGNKKYRQKGASLPKEGGDVWKRRVVRYRARWEEGDLKV